MRLFNITRLALGNLRDFFIPPLCLSCDNPVATSECLCARCWRDIDFIDQPRCAITGTPFAHGWPAHMESARARLFPPEYDAARSALRYESDRGRLIVTRLKFRDRPEIAIPAARWMARAGADILKDADIITPVPLHRRRLWSRRFNQSAEIARALSNMSGIAYISDILIRIRNTKPQTGLKRRERERNVRRAFILNPVHKERVKGKRVIVIDDVMTSGATTRQCARILRRAKVAHIGVLTLARVVHQSETHP